ncbi:phasin family protein [Alkalinema pantanalense CENA528]|uniref:phasin family protein n=1 Tax=Alkalinema pantanalense TaxID=1620705 RepID=UPI003D6DAD15
MGLGDLVQKAVYLGIGVASYAGEKAGEKLGELRGQFQTLADEMVERGEMTTEEAKRFVDDMIQKAQVQSGSTASSPTTEPRKIEILDEEETPSSPEASTAATTSPPIDQVAEMRRQVSELQEELRRLQRNN